MLDKVSMTSVDLSRSASTEPLSIVSGSDRPVYPSTDYPMGKELVMGSIRWVIYDRALEDGYNVGRHAYFQLVYGQDHFELLTPSDFERVIRYCLPVGLSYVQAEQWRATFILGWAGACLGAVPYCPCSVCQ